MELIAGFRSLLEEFRDVFNAQSFPIFVELMTGWVLSHRHRFITDLIVTSGSVGKRHFSNYHRFFSQYAWKLDETTLTQARLYAQQMLEMRQIRRLPDFAKFLNPRFSNEVATS